MISKENRQWIQDVILPAPGFLAPDEADVLISAARGIPHDQAIVEIGGYRGKSALALGWGSYTGHRAPVYSVDPHAAYTGVSGAQFGPRDRQEFYQQLACAQLGEIVRNVPFTSVVASTAWAVDQQPIGLLFIDGDHTESGVQSDLFSWRHYLHPQARVFFHDYNLPGVRAACETWSKLRHVQTVCSLAEFVLA